MGLFIILFMAQYNRPQIAFLLFIWSLLCNSCSAGQLVSSVDEDCLTNSPGMYYSLILDGNDCNRCSMLVHALDKTNKNQIGYVYFRNVPEFGKPDLLMQIGFDSLALIVLNDNQCFEKFVKKLDPPPGEKSGIIKYNKSTQTYSFQSFKKLLDQQEQSRFFGTDSADLKRTILDYKKYFSYAMGFTRFENYYFLTTNASSDMPVFDTSGSLIRTLQLDTLLWKKLYTVYEENILPDSVRAFNSDSLSLFLYHSYLKGMGQQLWAFQSAFVSGANLMCVVNVHFTINADSETIRHDGAEFILVYNKALELVNYYAIPRGRMKINYNGAAFNGIGYQQGKFKTFLYPVDSFALKETNPVSVSYDTSKHHILIPGNEKMPSIERSLLAQLTAKPSLFSLKHKYTANNYLYFERLPSIMDANSQIWRLPDTDTLSDFINFYSVEKEKLVISIAFYKGQLTLLELIPSKGGLLSVQKEKKITGIPADELIQTAFIDGDTCYILTLNDKTGLIVYQLPSSF